MNLSISTLAAAILMIGLTGCAPVQEAAEKAVSGGASQVGAAAAAEIKKQACDLAADGMVSVQDQRILSGLVAGAEAAGLPAEITGPLRTIAASGDKVPVDAVKALNDACAK